MEKVKPTLSFGFPLKVYVFTGDFQGVLGGFYKATRNKEMLWAPLYVDYKGRKIVDMTQARKVGKT